MIFKRQARDLMSGIVNRGKSTKW